MQGVFLAQDPTSSTSSTQQRLQASDPMAPTVGTAPPVGLPVSGVRAPWPCAIALRWQKLHQKRQRTAAAEHWAAASKTLAFRARAIPRSRSSCFKDTLGGGSSAMLVCPFRAAECRQKPNQLVLQVLLLGPAPTART